ncbi:MAG: MarR family winged helix-turn-helix transcriptional regulator [Microcella sp.]|uniref:DNA-binding MarR family transcriptional regulator n=1 Tax=Microcella frigidaquae TaxID=424758 RepID=A0A840XMP3_9MICO|nr:MarR family transcriptional regulator [Microcella frigidaquae]MBB5617888.1 DNA-binding MarR family transcriptional regulator [Microcella frigidaquae]NHN44398.1 MarR family transcriptional regulator [Microcella frigidaquae]
MDLHATDPEEELRVLIQKVARRIRAERAGEGISDSQLGVLWRLASEGRCTPSGLATAEKVSAPSMNRTLNALEASGLVRRDPSDDDARSVWVTITPAGEQVIAETRRLRQQWFHSQLETLSDAERSALEEVRPILRRLADA